jgi:hypothetical protein
MTAMSDPARAERFQFLEHRYDPHTGVATLAYGFGRGAPLVETITFPYAPWPEDPARQAAFLRALGLLHLVAGVSYYKAALPPVIDAGEQVLDARLAAFLENTWTEGLAEFAHVNELDLSGRIRFPVASGTDTETARGMSLAEPLELPARALVAIGGGKDSLVSLEWLRETGIEVQPVTVGASTLIGDTVRAAGLPLLRIQRELAPRLMDMNQAGAWNGHVPVTAINMAILTCAALLYGYRWVVFSNERSAEQATLTAADGRAVNHQYSKSLAFERQFRNVVHERVAPDLEVFSLLRPLSEAAVAQRFARLTAYHPVFSSCNRNFHRDGRRIEGRWCGDCPKCRFTCLALAPWLSPDELVAIQGANLLDDPAQEEGFRALCALGMDKPFECVGTLEESRALLAALVDQPAWANAAIVRRLGPEVGDFAGQLAGLLEPAGPHEIPDEVADRVGL